MGWLLSKAHRKAAGSWHFSQELAYVSRAKLAACDSGKPYSPKPSIWLKMASANSRSYSFLTIVSTMRFL
ncbi:hypothetical protein D3C81_1375460 [compost metagenome]